MKSAVGAGPKVRHLVPTQTWRIENNTFRNNDWHLMVLKSDGTEILNNRFEGTGTADRRVGIQFRAATFRSGAMNSAVCRMESMGNDPVFNGFLGTANNAQLNNNVFCDVVTPLTVQPTASHRGGHVDRTVSRAAACNRQGRPAFMAGVLRGPLAGKRILRGWPVDIGGGRYAGRRRSVIGLGECERCDYYRLVSWENAKGARCRHMTVPGVPCCGGVFDRFPTSCFASPELNRFNV